MRPHAYANRMSKSSLQSKVPKIKSKSVLSVALAIKVGRRCIVAASAHLRVFPLHPFTLHRSMSIWYQLREFPRVRALQVPAPRIAHRLLKVGVQVPFARVIPAHEILARGPVKHDRLQKHLHRGPSVCVLYRIHMFSQGWPRQKVAAKGVRQPLLRRRRAHIGRHVVEVFWGWVESPLWSLPFSLSADMTLTTV